MTNIALVVLDTLRKDAFDEHFDWLPGRRFDRAFSTANWTVPAHASLFTGQYSSEVGIHAKNMYCDCAEPTLAEQLRGAGYSTRAFSANTNITGHFDFDRGFTDFRTPEQFEHLSNEDIFDFREFSRTTDVTGKQKYLRAVYECIKSDASTIQSLMAGVKLLNAGEGVEYGGALEAIDEFRDTDFGDNEFLFLNLMEAHEPYRVPDDYQTVEEPDMTNSVGDISVGTIDGDQTTQAYDDCARYLSDIYKDLFEMLREEFDYIITLSDHGEMLGEYDAWGHEYGLYPELTHVPLCITGDGLDDTRQETVGLVDVHHTVLELAGIESGARGSSLLNELDENVRLTEYHGLTSWSERKLEQNGYEHEVQRYNEQLRGTAMPRDYYGFDTPRGFIEKGTATADDPREEMDQCVAELDVRTVDQNNEVPDEIKDQLKDLGYA